MTARYDASSGAPESAPRGRPVSGGVLRGRVVSGRKEAAGFVTLPWVAEQLEGLLGAPAFPGTLNVELAGASSLSSRRALAAAPGPCLDPPDSSFCSADYRPVEVAGEVAGAVVVPHVDGYPEHVVEVVAPVDLRERFGLRDGSEVALSWGSAAAKDRHLSVCLSRSVESRRGNGFADWELEGRLPDFAFGAIDTSTTLFGRSLALPLFISSMTGGGARSGHYNARLAQAAQETGIGMAVGSQKLMLEDPSLAADFQVRRWAPDVLLFADLGLVHVGARFDVDECRRAVEAIEADALMLYVNPLHEALQPAGDVDFSHLVAELAELGAALPYPVVVKEVGAGLPPATLAELARAPVAGVDVAGVGGTDWGRVEALLAGRSPDGPLEELGVATADSLRTAVATLPEGMVVLASGGIRDGVEVAKAVAMGARAAGMALPFLRWAHRSTERVVEGVRRIERELRVAMWYAGASDLASLQGRAQRRPVPGSGSVAPGGLEQ